jgi:hypothetical protein
MGALRSVEDYKHPQGTSDHNNNVAHGHANLKQDLTTTGSMDKYDALAGQTWESADQLFWRKMNQNPAADPWKVADEVSKIFKPVIEKRLALSITDNALLDDATMKGRLSSKAISPAGYKAYTDRTQHDRGWSAVQEALKGLPPPPPPGFFERLFQKQSTERKPAGVMGGE